MNPFRGLLALTMLALLVGCYGEVTDLGTGAGATAADPGTVSVTGELRSANSRKFGPLPIPDIWNYTIAFMAPDGGLVSSGEPVLRFDTQELMTKTRDKRNTLNEREKELEKQLILGKEQLAELKLSVEEARAALDKAALKADIPKTLLASREYMPVSTWLCARRNSARKSEYSRLRSRSSSGKSGYCERTWTSCRVGFRR